MKTNLPENSQFTPIKTNSGTKFKLYINVYNYFKSMHFGNRCYAASYYILRVGNLERTLHINK